MSSRNKRNKRNNLPPSQRAERREERLYRFTPPPPRPVETDFSKVCITADPEAPPPPPPPPGAEGDQAAGAGGGSAANSLKAGLRSRVLFSETMKKLIDERAAAFAATIQPADPVTEYVVRELARSTVQGELCSDQLTLNGQLAAERSRLWWADYRSEEADKLGQRIATAPCRIARQLGRTKYGALYLIDKLNGLSAVIASKGRLSDEQREYLLDLLGQDPILRDGCPVPPAEDGPGLAATVAKESARLTRNLERSLNARDLHEQDAAQFGIVKSYDQETRNLRSDEARALRRKEWCWRVLEQIGKGVDPTTIIDPETGQPIKPVPYTSVAPKAKAKPKPKAEAAPPPPAPTEPPPEPPAATQEMPPVPDGCPDDVKPMYYLLGEALIRHQAQVQANGTSPKADPPSAGEAGPDTA